MSNLTYSGYSGVLWSYVFKTMRSFTELLAAFNTAPTGQAPSLNSIALAAEGMLLSLNNGVEAIDAFALNNAWQTEINLLQQIQALPLSLDPTTLGFVNNRIAAYEAAQAGLNVIVPKQTSFLGPGVINQGNPVIPSAGLLNFFSIFPYESAPPGLTNANLIANAYAVQTAFETLAAAILAFQGANVTQLYDVAIREALCAQSAANILAAMTSPGFDPNVGGMNTWNQVVALPAMLICADSITGAAFTEQLQQQAVLRNVMLVSATQVTVLLLSLRQPLTAQINLTTLRVGETLIDVAARALGNFELWPEIAALNGLIPPYVGPTMQPGIAAWGTQLVLPTPGTRISAIGNIPSYSINFLGNDLFIGPINGEMPVWTSDFQIISGYNNLRISLGRRLQTTQGTLIYHPEYGSRIPPEVGNIQTDLTAGHINAYGRSALQSDPRVARVLQAKTALQSGGLVSFSATVQPNGFNSSPITLNEVISPVP